MKNILVSRLIAIISIQILLFLFFFEAGIRAYLYAVKKTNQGDFQQYSQIYSDERSSDYLYWHHPEVSVKLTRGDYNFTFTTNALGHRSANQQVTQEKSLVFLGDSIIEGASLEDHETIPYLMGTYLGLPAVNLGLGSANTVHEYFVLKNKVLEWMAPPLVILGYCLNDTDQNLFRRAFDPTSGNWEYFDTVAVDLDRDEYEFVVKQDSQSSPTSIKDILKKSEVIMLAYRLYIYWGGNRVGRVKASEPLAWQNTEFFLRRIQKEVNRRGSKLLVVLFPTRSQVEFDDLTLEQETLKKILLRNGITFYDAFPDMRNHVSSETLFHDHFHPNEEGAMVVALGLANFIQENRILDDGVN